jgi:hypothetical protein
MTFSAGSTFSFVRESLHHYPVWRFGSSRVLIRRAPGPDRTRLQLSKAEYPRMSNLVTYGLPQHARCRACTSGMQVHIPNLDIYLKTREQREPVWPQRGRVIQINAGHWIPTNGGCGVGLWTASCTARRAPSCCLSPSAIGRPIILPSIFADATGRCLTLVGSRPLGSIVSATRL